MFDGSHRTNRREINLAGRTSRSSRTSTLKEAREQRLARAAAKAKTNAATLLQRCWRGVAARIRVGVALRGEFDAIIDRGLTQTQSEISRLVSLMAFRLSPALISFFACDQNTKGVVGRNKPCIETNVSRDLLSLHHLLQSIYTSNANVVSAVAARRLSITILILLRQSYQFGTLQIEQSEIVLAQLLDYLMEQSFADDKSIHTSSGGWLVTIFLCLRDSYLGKHKLESSMDVDDGGEIVQKILLKSCCRAVIQLVTEEQNNASEMIVSDDMAGYECSIALLGSIVFVTGLEPANIPTWMSNLLTELISSVENRMHSQNSSTSDWVSVIVHFLSCGLRKMPKITETAMNIMKISRSMAETIQSLSLPSPLSSELWLNALSDSVKTREHVILGQVLSYADVKNQSAHHQRVFTYSIPMILQYSLQQQQELYILAGFAARGEDVMAWTTNNSDDTALDSVPSNSLSNAAVAYHEESESDSDDEQFQQQSNQMQQQTHTSGRQSRADLQTMPKLDTLYQTQMLNAKKRVMEQMQFRNNETQRCALAAKIGSGQLLLQLGGALFSLGSTNDEPMSGILAKCFTASHHEEANESYTSSLATIMTSCSGLKAGRNASSPLLAKLAFNESLLNGFWAVAKEKASVITCSLSSSTSISGMGVPQLTSAYETLSAFCDMFSHWNLAVDDDLFLQKYYNPDLSSSSPVSCLAKDLVITLKFILSDLYWVRPVLASDISSRQSSLQNDADASIRFQRARLLLSGTKLWNCLYERWCRLFRTAKFCDEEAWWFPQLSSRGQHDNNPVIHSQVTSVDQEDDAMEESSIEDVNAGASINNDAGMDALATSFRDPKMARILTCIPQALPFSRRVDLFQNLLESDKAKTQDESAAFRQMMMNWDSDGESYSGREKVTIRRDSLYTDSMISIMPLGKRLRKKLQVTFVNQHGIEEAGIDGGGVQKEFFDDLIKDAFLPSQHTTTSEDGTDNMALPSHPDFFVETSLETLQVNTALTRSGYLQHYEFLGRVLGKTMYESILVDPQFSLPFLNKVLGKQNTLDDLKNLDPEYYKHLISLRHMSANDISSLGLTFEMTISAGERYSHSTVELIPGGRDIPVTKENVIQYIHLVSHQRMNVAGARQTAAFLHGFREIIPASWVRLFSAYEFQKLISGDDTVKGIDVGGMMSVMRYSGGYHPSQPIIHWLWEVVDEMTPEQQRKFLRFMTSCSRQPLLGFNSLVPAPCIQQTRLREDDYGNDVSDELTVGNIRLPSSSTCMNLLKLPKYPSKAMLREKLLYAIESAAGFELS